MSLKEENSQKNPTLSFRFPDSEDSKQHLTQIKNIQGDFSKKSNRNQL